jgi:nicotinamidase-related amidase
VFGKRCYDIFDETYGQPYYLLKWLKDREVTKVFLGGVVGNICVEAAALGLRKHGFEVVIPNSATVWMDISSDNNEQASRKRLTEAGVRFI